MLRIHLHFFWSLASCILDPVVAHANSGAKKPRLAVYAASSLVDVLPAIAAKWESGNALELDFHFEGSSRLAKQIKEGAPADVFISADEEWMDYLIKERLIRPDSRLTIISNNLVLVVSASSKLTFATPLNLSPLKQLALAAENVPVARYAAESLIKTNNWETVRARIIRGDNVRTVLKWVASKEVEAGIVYRSDALAEKGRTRIAYAFHPDTHRPILYPAGITVNSRIGDLAKQFLHHCIEQTAQQMFAEAGFLPAGGK